MQAESSSEEGKSLLDDSRLRAKREPQQPQGMIFGLPITAISWPQAATFAVRREYILNVNYSWNRSIPLSLLPSRQAASFSAVLVPSLLEHGSIWIAHRQQIAMFRLQ